MRVLWITNVPSPYRVDFFNELGKSCDLTVVFEKRTSDERDKSWLDYKFENFNGIFLNGKSINTDTAICPGVVKYVKDKGYDHIVVTNISSPTGIIAIAYMRANHIPYWIEGDGGFAKADRGIKHKLKTFMITGAKGYFSTSKSHDEYYLSYGADPQRIHRYPFTSIKKEDILKADLLTDSDKKTLRKQLKMNEPNIILSVGRFSYEKGYGKGFDLLMETAEMLGKDYGVYIVGDEPTDEFKGWKDEHNLLNVHFVPFLRKNELAKYYAAADCMVLLTRGESWGLVINEAMVYGLPIITTPQCVAGTELVEDGVNGFIVSINDIDDITNKIKRSMKPEYKSLLGQASYEKIKDFTIEKMAQTHIEDMGG